MTMALDRIFNIAGSALNAQTVRMNTTASNLANSSTVASSEKDAFRAKRANFQSVLKDTLTEIQGPFAGGVKVKELVNDPSPIRRMMDKGNPLADQDGFVYMSNVNEMSEMVEMMSASRSYQNNVEVVNTARTLLSKTVDLLKS
jgi:flagellar basal-body rod protein FlgC